MSVDTHGDKNRTAGRDFYENTLQVDKVNIVIPHPKQDLRPLVPAQRKQLNQLVREIAETEYEEAFSVWQRLHAEIGVNSIDEITVGQYTTALSYLQVLRDRYREKDASNALVHLLLTNATQPELRQQLTRYCHIHFGTGRLTELTRSQLQQALLWLDDRISSMPPASIFDSEETWIPWRKAILANPAVFIVVLVVGILLGAFMATRY